MLLAVFETAHKGVNSFGLIALRFVVRNEFKIHSSISRLIVADFSSLFGNNLLYEEAKRAANIVDLRVSKIFSFGDRFKARGYVDFFNLCSSALLNQNNRHWRIRFNYALFRWL